MTDYTPAKPIEAGCMAIVIAEIQGGVIVKVFEKSNQPMMCRGKLEPYMWRVDRKFIKKDRSFNNLMPEYSLMRIDDPSEEVSESTTESIPAEEV